MFHDGNEYILADGFHRVMAASRNLSQTISSDVRKGTKLDALKFALGANITHGLKRTNADKRHSVMLAVEAWPELNDQAVADLCGVGKAFVNEYRKELSSVDNSIQPATRKGKDGKKYPTTKAKKRRQPIDIQAAPSPEPEPVHIQTAEQETSDDPSPAYSRIMQRLVEDQADFKLLKNEDEQMQVKQSMRELAERLS